MFKIISKLKVSQNSEKNTVNWQGSFTRPQGVEVLLRLTQQGG